MVLPEAVSGGAVPSPLASTGIVSPPVTDEAKDKVLLDAFSAAIAAALGEAA